MNKYQPMVLLALLVLAASCGKQEEKGPKEATVFSISPAVAPSESGFAHDLYVKVTCDIAFSAALGDESWMSLSGSEEGENNLTVLTLSMETNAGPEVRSTELTITAGTQVKTIKITQQSLGTAISATEVSLNYTRPSSISVTLPADWTIVLDSGDWLECEPMEGKAKSSVTVSFRAKSLNLTDEVRNCKATVSAPGGNVDITVSQNSSLPEGDFASGSYGIYNFDGSGSNIVYDELAHQTNIVKYPSELVFRLIDPAGLKFFEISGMPVSPAPGDALTLTMYQNWDSGLAYRTETEAQVLKVEDHTVWMLDAGDVGYVTGK